MRIVFMGTASFAVPSLESVASGGFDVAGVVTQPDRPGGRGQRLQPSPVKTCALGLGLEVEQPAVLTQDIFGPYVTRHRPDVLVVVAYGKLLPRWLIDSPPFGVVNLHASLLPRYRGAAPVNWAIASGETVTGVCTMQIDDGLDTGPVYACRETPIGPMETAPVVLARLAGLGALLLCDTLRSIETGAARPTPQSAGAATTARRLRRDDGYVHWGESAPAIHNKIRGFLPWPSVVVSFRGKRCRLLASRVCSLASVDLSQGEIRGDRGMLLVGCGDLTVLEVLSVQLENRKAMSGTEFLNGFHPGRGERFGSLEEGDTA